MKCGRSGRLVLSLMLVLSTAATVPESDARRVAAFVGPTQVMQKAPPVPDIKIVISLTKEKFEVGEPVLLSIVVTSPGGRESIPVWGPMAEDQFWPVVDGVDRDDPRLTDHGKSSLGGLSKRPVGVEEIGEEPESYVIALDKFYDLSEGGTFGVSVTRPVSTDGGFQRYVNSQALGFQVGAARPGGKPRDRQWDQPIPGAEVRNWGPERSGLQLAARLRKPSVQSGEVVLLDVYTRNLSSAEINLGYRRNPYDYSLVIRDSEGRLVDEPEPLPELPMLGGPTGLVPPGSVMVTTLHLTPRYALTSPGRYVVSVSRDATRFLGAETLLESLPVELEVQPRPQPFR